VAVHEVHEAYCHVSRVPWLIITGSGFGWLDLLALLLQLHSVVTAHNQWQSKTRSSPYWTMSVFSSAVTDLVLIYESVTSSATVLRWLTLDSWRLNSLMAPNEFTDEISFISRAEPKREHYLQQFVCYILCLFVATKRASSETLSSNGLFRHNMKRICKLVPYTDMAFFRLSWREGTRISFLLYRLGYYQQDVLRQRQNSHFIPAMKKLSYAIHCFFFLTNSERTVSPEPLVVSKIRFWTVSVWG
jgi:hypothetical protein